MENAILKAPMTAEERVIHWNKQFPKWPNTIYDKGWIYGVWYCGTSFQKVELYGQYPQTFLKRALALFPDIDESRILHAPSGILEGPGVTVDSIQRKPGCPQIIADVTDMPFKDNRFDLVLTDPPYSEADSKIYGCKKYPKNKAMKEFRRVLSPGGYLGWLDVRYPMFRRKDWDLIGLCCVVTGFMRVTRMFSIFQSKKEDE